MDKLLIEGGRKLSGNVSISGSKNAVLPIMVATIIEPGKYTIKRVPKLRDTLTMIKLLEIIGAKVELNGDILKIDTNHCNNPEAPYDLVKTMRASFYVLGPFLSRFGYAKVSMPGGCAWGPRPIDFHIDAIKQIGAKVDLSDGYIIANGDHLKGGEIVFPVSSVGATGNAVMASVKVNGVTKIINAAIEPEITCLCEFLNNMGANIAGIGTNELTIEGVDKLYPVDCEIIPDRIEAATFLIAGAIKGEDLTINDIDPNHLKVITKELKNTGCELKIDSNSIQISKGKKIKPVSIETAIYPGFPTDVQAQWMTLMSLAKGSSTIVDAVYHDRFTHIAELSRLGAKISLKYNVAQIKGVKRLYGTNVMSTDIRASASLIIAGLAAEGETEVSRVYHIDRGYENIEGKFNSVGANIKRVKE